MTPGDESRQNRRDLAILDTRIGNATPIVFSGTDLVATVSALPANAGVGTSFELKIARVTGPDGPAGTAGEFADPGNPSLFAICLGPNVPASGDRVLCSPTTDGRWVFQR